ncbi:uncharacterized protein PpBr36_10434, partial [Pyricularia pennisetigena]|uniref:uncharacterized protein n=1 Tax=Pyricularia pennisetigena TaxID=1578925 RepID=UPI00114EF459
MDVSTWYAIGVFGVITLCIVVCMFFRLSRAVCRLGKRVFFRYLIYSDIPKSSGHSYYITRYECLLFLSVLTKPEPSKREEVAGFLRKRPLSCTTIQPINYTTPSGERIPVFDAVHLH